MSKKQIKRVILMGVGCAVLLVIGVIYSLIYNEGRWVTEMNLSDYAFSVKDIPMLIVGLLIALYTIYILVVGVKTIQAKKSINKMYSRTVSPLWGICGIFGFLGFGGFWTYQEYGQIFPFIFFVFFGFFGIKPELFQSHFTFFGIIIT